MIKNSATKYGTISKLFHWGMGIGYITLIGVGFWMSDLPNSDEKFAIYALHKSFGITLLGLVFLRLIWRNMNIQPALPDEVPNLQRKLSRLVHTLLYIMMILMPIIGWSMSSAGGHPVKWFNLVELPSLFMKDEYMMAVFKNLHAWGGILFAAIIIAHTLGGLYHHFYLKDNILKRMLPFCSK